MDIKAFFDKDTFTMTYIVIDTTTKDAVIIDPVLDFDPASGKISHDSIHQVVTFVKTEDLKVKMILETHAHADHLSGARELLNLHLPGVPIAIGENITVVQSIFKKIFNLPEDFATDGSQFQRLLKDGEEVTAGSLNFKVMFTPGHTPACASYIFGDAVFVGDALFMPDYGTGRCDFPAGDANALFHSVSQRLYSLPDTTRVFVGHDYQPNGRPLAFETTIGASKKQNIQLKADTREADYVSFRKERDATLKAPRLLLPSIQVNIAAGTLPTPESNGVSYLKLPLRTPKA